MPLTSICVSSFKPFQLLRSSLIHTHGDAVRLVRFGGAEQSTEGRTVIRVQRSEAAAGELEREFRNATDVKYRDRLQIVRLAHRGRKHQEIAAEMGITPRAV